MKLNVSIELTLPQDGGSFQEAEVKIREAMFKGGQALMIQLLDLYETMICERRKQFWKKDMRKKRYQTLVGEVVKERWRVFDHRRKKYIYPLDEWLGLNIKERATPGLRKEIVEACVQRPYRQATREIEKGTGIKRPTMANWHLLQDEARRQKEKEAPPYDWHLKPLPVLSKNVPEDPCPIIAIDPDGTYCRNQDKEAQDHDVKVAVLYTAKQKVGKSKKYGLFNKQVLLSQSKESIQDFFNRVTQTAMSQYGAHSQTRVLIHGDGDPWIKGLKTNYWDRALLRLDPYHVKKKVRIALGFIRFPETWEQPLYTNPDKFISIIKTWMTTHVPPRSPQRKNILELIAYLENNREGLLPSGVHKEIKAKYPRMFLRGSGTIESNVGSAVADRFKQRRMSWSQQGLDHLSFLREKFLNNYPKPKYVVPKPFDSLKLGYVRKRQYN